MDVVKRLNELSEIETSDAFVKSAPCGYVVEKLSASGKLKYDEDHCLLSSILLLDYPIVAELCYVHDVRIAKRTLYLDLSDDKVQILLVNLLVLFLQDLHNIVLLRYFVKC